MACNPNNGPLILSIVLYIFYNFAYINTYKIYLSHKIYFNEYIYVPCAILTLRHTETKTERERQIKRETREREGKDSWMT